MGDHDARFSGSMKSFGVTAPFVIRMISSHSSRLGHCFRLMMRLIVALLAPTLLVSQSRDLSLASNHSSRGCMKRMLR